MSEAIHDLAKAASRLWAHRGLALVVVIALLLGAAHGARAAASAGAAIVNVATLSYRLDGAEYGAASNPVTVVVNEVIDFSVVEVGDLTVASGAIDQAVAFRLTNRGNARRAFALALDPGLAGDGFDPASCRIYIDRLNATVADPGAAQLYVHGSEPELAAGETVTLWAVCDIPEGAAGSARIALHARPVLAAGDTAVAMWTHDQASAINTYWIDGVLSAELIKTQSVVDAMGRPRAIKGATVTYSLKAALRGVGTARDLVISDPIPAGSTYVRGSLRLDGVALSDSEDADAGKVSPEGVQVRLGDVAAPAQRTVTFQVVINP